MFKMQPAMDFGKRFSFFWSYTWRVWLATLPVTLAMLLLVMVTVVPAVVNLVHEGAGAGSVVTAMLSFVFVWVILALASLVMLPISGYMARRAMIAQSLPVPTALTLWKATRIGVTAWFWAVVVSFLSMLAGTVLGPLILPLGLIISIAGSMYLKLPRVVRRMNLYAAEAA